MSSATMSDESVQNNEKIIDDLMLVSSMRNFVFLIGNEEGAIQCAKLLSKETGKSLEIINNGIHDSITDIYGYIDLKNNYHSTKIVDSCENGKILLITNVEKSTKNILSNLFSIIDLNIYHKGSVLGFKPRTKDNAMFPPDVVCDANNMVISEGNYVPKDGFFMIASTTNMEIDILLKDRGTVLKL